MSSKKPLVHRYLVPGLLVTVGVVDPALAAGDAERRLVVHVCGRAEQVEAARAEEGLGEAAVASADVLPNPSFVLQHQQTLEGPADRETIVGLGVPLGLGGGRFKRQDAAELRRAAGRARGASSSIAAAIDVQATWTGAALDRGRADVMRRHQERIDALEAVIAGLARGGEVAGHERDRHRIKAARHRAALGEAEARAAGGHAALQAWGHTGAAPTPSEASLLAPTAWPRSPAASPRLEALALTAKADEVEAEAARRAWVPDVDLFGGYRNVAAGDATGHGIAVWLTVPITLFDRGQGEAAIADGEARRGRAQLVLEQQAIARTDRALQARVARLEQARDEAATAAREAERVAAVALTLYRAGESSLTDLFDALDDVESAELIHLDLLGDLAEARVAWMEARGALLDAGMARACQESTNEGTP